MTPIYHITHINNLPGLLRFGGICSDTDCKRRGLQIAGIAYQDLKGRRVKRRVQCLTGKRVATGGVLADYVPFYFANRSPMLYAIHTGSVQTYTGSQREIVYLVSSVERAIALDKPWCFTDGHAFEAVTDFFDELHDMDKVDWEVITSWSWHNRPDDNDRKRRKQAEFLVHDFFPWIAVESLAVIDTAIAKTVRKLLMESSQNTTVSIEPSWYY